MNNSTVNKGKATELQAQHYLESQGLTLHTCNFHSRGGEVDLIMQDQDTYVFVEVKYRKNNLFGGALSTISNKKIQKIKQCATYYLQHKQINAYNTPCRFDVVALEGDINKPTITWLKNAF